jgi:hypothetical protein
LEVEAPRDVCFVLEVALLIRAVQFELDVLEVIEVLLTFNLLFHHIILLACLRPVLEAFLCLLGHMAASEV